MMRKAPWTDVEIQNLRDYQTCGIFHPFTGEGCDLIPTPAGWVEREGGPVVQDWAHDWMVDGSWRARLEQVEGARTMTQTAPWPAALARLVKAVRYKAGWTFELSHLDRGQDSVGLTLSILIETPDSYEPTRTMNVYHYFIVPAAAYDERSWRRWLFDQIVLVERHEAMEFFAIDGDRPYAPSHGPGNDPYMVREVGTDEDRRTTFRGEILPRKT